MRVKKIPLETSVQVMTEAENLMREREFEPSSDAVLSLASPSGATAYDCEFVALAQLFDIPLLTRDRRLHGLPGDGTGRRNLAGELIPRDT